MEVGHFDGKVLAVNTVINPEKSDMVLRVGQVLWCWDAAKNVSSDIKTGPVH